MYFLSLGKITRYLWFIILCPFTYLLRDIAFKYIFILKFSQHPLIVSLIMFLSECLAGTVEIVFCCINRSKRLVRTSIIDGKKQEVIKVIKEKPLNFSSTKVFLLISMSAFIDLICYTVISFLYSSKEIETQNIPSEMRITPIFFMSVLSWKNFHFEIYKHHLVSIGIVGVGFILICINRLIKLENLLVIFIVFICVHIVYSVKQINDKYIMDKKYISPFYLLLYQGIIGSIFTIICIFISYAIPCKENWTFCEGNKFEDFTEVINKLGQHLDVIPFLFLLLFSSTFVNVFLMLIKKYLTPTHRSVADSFNAFFTWAYTFTYDQGWSNKWDSMNFLDIFGYLLIIIGCLIYNEIIILHVLGLDRDTKKEIIERAIEDNRISLKLVDPIEINDEEDNIDILNN